MAITSKNQLAIAYKKLVGKSHSTPRAGAIEEPFASAVQLGSSEIFAQDPTSTKTYDQNTGDITQEEIVPYLAELYTFDLVAMPSSEYSAVINQTDTMKNEGDVNILGKHGYRIKFKNDDTVPVSLKGKFVDQDIKLQLIPPKYGNIYSAMVFEEDGTTRIEPDGSQDWSLDYYSGILFVQDLASSIVPTTLQAYLYTGKYVSDVVYTISETLPGEEQSTTLLKAQVERLEVIRDGEPAPTFNHLEDNAETAAKFSGSVGVSGDLEVNGTLHTKKLIVEETTQVITNTVSQANNIFGDEATSQADGDTHTFYGDVNINGNLSVTGDSPSKHKVFVINQTNTNDVSSQNYSEFVFDDQEESTLKNSLFLVNHYSEPFDATDDNVRIFLPAIDLAWNGTQYIFKHLCDEGHEVIVQGTDATIDGNDSVRMYARYETLTIVAYDGQWHIV